MKVRNPATEYDSFQIKFFTKFFPVIIKAPAQSQPPVFRPDENIYPIQDITIGIVGVETIGPSDLPVGVFFIKFRVINYYGEWW